MADEHQRKCAGAFEVDLAWDNHKLTSAKIQSISGQKAVVPRWTSIMHLGDYVGHQLFCAS
jgi:hypothetical protein